MEGLKAFLLLSRLQEECCGVEIRLSDGVCTSRGVRVGVILSFFALYCSLARLFKVQAWTEHRSEDTVACSVSCETTMRRE